MSGAYQLLTIGYAGYDPDSFVARLRDHGVETIVDIRQNPVSRKRGFSKSKLERFLGEHGIATFTCASWAFRRSCAIGCVPESATSTSILPTFSVTYRPRTRRWHCCSL
jgi:hypothetical protein